MPRVRQSSSVRKGSGKLDIVIIVVISLLLIAALIYLLFQIIGHSEEHVDTVRKTKVIYNESLRWRPDSGLCETRIQEDLMREPKRKKAEYTDLALSEKCLELIGRMNRLEELKLTRSTLQDDWLNHLTRLPLQSLGVHGTPLTDKAIPYILKLKSLSHLSIGDTEITDKGLELLSASKSLHSIELNMPRNVTDDGIKHIGKMTQLTQLEVTNSRKLTGKCLAHLSNLKDLQHLNLEGLSHTVPEDFRALASLTKLHSLNVSGSQLPDRSIAEIAKVSSIRNLILRSSDLTNKGLLALAKSSNLNSLIITDCPNLDDATVNKFRAAEPQCNVKYAHVRSFADTLKKDKVQLEVEFLEDEVRNEMQKTKGSSKAN